MTTCHVASFWRSECQDQHGDHGNGRRDHVEGPDLQVAEAEPLDDLRRPDAERR